MHCKTCCLCGWDVSLQRFFWQRGKSKSCCHGSSEK